MTDPGTRSAETHTGRRALAWLAISLGTLAVLAFLVMGTLDFLTHGTVGWQALAAHRRPIVVSYGIIFGFDGQAPQDLELLLPIPTLDGKEIAGFREELARQRLPAEIVSNDRGVFLRFTADSTRGRSTLSPTVDVTLQEKIRDADVARRLGVSGVGGPEEVWAYFQGDRAISRVLLVSAAHSGWSPITQVYVRFQSEASTGEWLSLEEGF